MAAEILTLRLVHVLGGILWVGSAVFMTVFLMPALARSGVNPGPIMAGLQQRRLDTILPVVALLTVLSGLRLLWIMSGGLDATYFAHASGLTYGLSGLVTIVAFVLGLLVARPTMFRAGELARQLATAQDDDTRVRLKAEIGRLQRRGAVAREATMWLLVLAAAGMAVARYL